MQPRSTLDPRLPAAALVVVAALGAGVFFGRGVAPIEPASDTAGRASPTVAVTPPARIAVHVAGWVEAPGVVEVAEGSRVADAVALAGGARPGAALDSVNLAAPVVDGQHVMVPGPGDGGAGSVGPGGDNPAIRVNAASVSELEELPGVGPVLAARIVAHRDSTGPFETVEDLLDVPGIGESTLADLRDRVVVP